MVRMRYSGISDKAAFFAALAPAFRLIRDTQMRCTPLGPEYIALGKAKSGLQEAAADLLGEESPFKPLEIGGPYQGFGGKRQSRKCNASVPGFRVILVGEHPAAPWIVAGLGNLFPELLRYRR